MTSKRQPRRKQGITRREFMQYSAAAGAALSLPRLFAGCGDSGGGHTANGDEYRTFYFDLSHADPDHDYYLRAGNLYLNLNRMDPETLETARRTNPLLGLVPGNSITHYAWEAPMPALGISLCWIVGVAPSARDGSWSMPLMFCHLPASSLRSAAQRPGAAAESAAAKFQIYGAGPRGLAGIADALLLADDFKNWQDQAVSMVFCHQELLSAQADSAAHIQTNIISPHPRTQMLAGALQAQGPATEDGGWATQEAYIDPDTGKPYLNSLGQKQYFPRWSDMTLQATGGAVAPCLQQAKNDTSLGVDITDLDPNQENAAVSGTIWKVHDGVTTVDAGSQAGLQDGNPVFSFANQSPEAGYKVEKISQQDGKIEFTAHNWYARYLGVYVRFLDANDAPIAVADLPSSTTDCFSSWGRILNTKYDNFAFTLGAEFEILGIPVKSIREEIQFAWPEGASSALILASGLGTGDGQYVPGMDPGGVLTALLNLATPAIFLVFGAGLSYAQWARRFTGEADSIEIIKLVTALAPQLVEDGVLAGIYEKPDLLIEVAKTLGEYILSRGATWFISSIIEALGGAEAEDSIPVIGAIFNAIGALGMIAEIAETGEEIRRSPKTYVEKLTFTHDLTVTIHHDPEDFEFPAVATRYKVNAYFDNGATPFSSDDIRLDGTRSDPLVHTFTAVPYGGTANIQVGFYSTNDWLAGQGSTGPFPNDASHASQTITITENKVPLRIDTLYSHREKTALDAGGNLVWQAAAAPTATRAALNCGNANGDLCQMSGITVSQHFAAAGYAWKAYSQGMTLCGGSGHAQLFQFAGMSLAQNPQSGYATSGCGFSSPIRIVYDLMGSQERNFYLDGTGGKKLVRQIRLAGGQPPDFDGPGSNRCWGAFSLPSDAFLLHPQGKLVSISSQYDKIERWVWITTSMSSGFRPQRASPVSKVWILPPMARSRSSERMGFISPVSTRMRRSPPSRYQQ